MGRLTWFWWLALFALLYGTAYGGWVALLPSVVMDSFGGRNVSAIIGGRRLRSPARASPGAAFDLTHSYTMPILASVVANVIAAALAASPCGPRQHEPIGARTRSAILPAC